MEIKTAETCLKKTREIKTSEVILWRILPIWYHCGRPSQAVLPLDSRHWILL
jgi:hypothetical protein